jgi:hypothetical protein
MNPNTTLDVIDREGWRKELPLERTIVHIGSDPRSDIVLEPTRGAGVAPLHAQLIAANSGLGYQLVNLGDTDILLGPSGDQVLPPRSVTRLADGLVFKLGEFTLIFHSGGEGPSEGFAGDSRYIGLKLSLLQTRLSPKRSLEGQVTVSNLGDRSGAQFNLELEGLEPDCFDIEPGPILAAGATKEVSFRLYHRGDKPLAGDRRIVIRAEAPHAYPGEEMTVSQVIEILPLYRHSLRLLSPDRVEPAPQAEAQPAAARVAPPPAPATEPSPQAEDWWAASPAGATEPKPRVPAASRPQTAASQPSRATSPAAEAKPPAGESAAPAAPAAEPERTAEAAWGALAIPAAEVTPPSVEAAPLPAVAEAAPPAEAALALPAVEQAVVRVPQAEPAAAPPKKGWARLVQSIPFFHAKPVAPPSGTAEAVVQPQAATPASVEAGPPPVTESAPVAEEETAAVIVQEQKTPETSLPPQAEERPIEAGTSMPASDEGEVTTATETIAPVPVQEQPALAADPQPASGGESATPPEPELPEPEDEGREPLEITPQVQAEEEKAPRVEGAPAEASKRRRALKLKASPPPETKEAWVPPVEAEPAPAGDWWTPQIGQEEKVQAERALKLKADLPPEEKAEPAPSPAEDWWASAASSTDISSTRPVLKLKASPPVEKEPPRAPAEAGPPPPSEDWWTAEGGVDAEAPAEKRQVLKLKASPPPEGEAEQPPIEGEPPPAEDWWTP